MTGRDDWLRAFSLVQKTIPFIGVNAVVYGAFVVVSLLWFGVWSALAIAAGAAELDLLVVGCLVVAISGWGAGASFLRRYVLYLVKGAHIAVMTEFLHRGTLPEDRSQFEYGREIVEENFEQIQLLFALDQLLERAVQTFQRELVQLAEWLPAVDNAERFAGVLAGIVDRAVRYVDEAILSHVVARGDGNPWKGAREGVVLYAQSWRPIMKTAGIVWMAHKVVVFAAFLLFLVPAVAWMLLVGSTVAQILGLVLAGAAAWATVKALFEPFATAYVLVVYHRTVAGEDPDPTWDRRLKAVSEAYRELAARADAAAGG
ncbi:MAG: hypothetical protein ABEL76_14860 [Bradymonadaceae bacterium]